MWGSPQKLEITDPSVLIAIWFFGMIVVLAFALMKKSLGHSMTIELSVGVNEKKIVGFFSLTAVRQCTLRMYINVRSCIWLVNNNNNNNQSKNKPERPDRVGKMNEYK